MMDFGKIHANITNNYRKNILGMGDTEYEKILEERRLIDELERRQLRACKNNRRLSDNETNIELDNRERARDMNNI